MSMLTKLEDSFYTFIAQETIPPNKLLISPYLHDKLTKECQGVRQVEMEKFGLKIEFFLGIPVEPCLLGQNVWKWVIEHA